MANRFAPVFLATDFSVRGPYVGLLKAAAMKVDERLSVVDLIHDLPAFEPAAAGMLLAALLPFLPERAVIAAVVDPGVGGDRPALAVELAGHWLIGPGNGLFDAVVADALAQGGRAVRYEIQWRPERLSSSFHGRDLFIPVAAMLACGCDKAQLLGPGQTMTPASPSDGGRCRIIYIDGYGNCMTGLRQAELQGCEHLYLGDGRRLERAQTFSSVQPGTAFWYVNSLGLAEIAVNGGSASAMLGLSLGDRVGVQDDDLLELSRS